MELATEQQADREEAAWLGAHNPELAWILTDRDVWHANPCYRGPVEPHPEDDHSAEYIAEYGIDAWRKARAAWHAAPGVVDGSDDIPF